MLAIVGILSVIGIAGFSKMVDKNKANTLIQEAQKRAVVVAGQIGFGQNVSLSEFTENTFAGGNFSDVVTDGLTKQFGIKVDEVEKNVCQNVLNTIGDTTPIRRLSKTDTLTTPIVGCDDNKSSYIFVYNNDMQSGTSDTQYCESDDDCQTVCGKCSATIHLCENECFPPENECETDSQCNAKNECMICDTETNKCKDGCKRVQYLESNGSQWINTGIKNNMNTQVNFRFARTMDIVQDVIIGNRINDNDDFRFFVSSSYFIFDMANVRTYHVENNQLNIIYNIEINKSFLSINGTHYNIAYKESVNEVDIGLFGGYYNNLTNVYYSNGIRIYDVKIYDDGTPVRDFVPVLSPETSDYGGKPCMFNRVPEDGKLKLYCGTGTFDYGPK